MIIELKWAQIYITPTSLEYRTNYAMVINIYSLFPHAECIYRIHIANLIRF